MLSIAIPHDNGIFILTVSPWQGVASNMLTVWFNIRRLEEISPLFVSRLTVKLLPSVS